MADLVSQLVAALELCQRALQSQWSPYLRAGDKEAAAMKAAASALSAAKAGGWVTVKDCPDGDVWFALSCGHVVMGWKQGELLDWEAQIDHDCCHDAPAIKCQPVAVPAPPAQKDNT